MLRAGDGGATLAEADIITDFTDGTDLIDFREGDFSGLDISQGTGDNASDTILSFNSEFLATQFQPL